MTQSLTRHDRRKDRTRKQIQDAMLDLILTQGYEELVIQQIADLADVGRGTFYFHFDSKEDLLWSIVEDRFPLQADYAASLFEGDLPDQPEFYCYVNRFRQFEKNRTVFLAVFGSKGSQAAASRVQQILVGQTVQEIKKFRLYQEIHPAAEIAAQIVVGLMISLATWWLETSSLDTAVQMAKILYQTLHHREPPGGSWQEGNV